MTLINDYEEKIKEWDMYPDSIKPGIYIFGMMAELGEVANKYKKVFRDHGGILDHRQKDYALEIGDILWYLVRLSNHMGFTLEEVIEMNMEKLGSRFERKKIKGTGDHR